MCYLWLVKDITVSLPEEVYRRVELRAAERETSISGLVADLLSEIAGDDERDFERRRNLQREVIASIREFRAGDRLTREEVHDRLAVR